jgi:Icc-related predicted phosphoesterase
MRILAFSDLHEDEAALESLTRLSKDFDQVLICGDVSRTNHFAQAVLEAFPKAFLIPGNWDNKLINDIFSSSPQWVHGRRKELGTINIVGFGYSSFTPFDTYGELSEEEIYERMSKLPIDRDTILMLHCPPKGHFDMTFRGGHGGSESILKVIKEKRPLAALFGHIHDHEGVEELDGTTLIKLPAANAMRACSITVEDKGIKAEFIPL